MESLSLNSTVDHPGGSVTLRSERSWNDAVVLDASLTAVKVGPSARSRLGLVSEA
jgi:hypothetical protein